MEESKGAPDQDDVGAECDFRWWRGGASICPTYAEADSIEHSRTLVGSRSVALVPFVSAVVLFEYDATTTQS